MELCRVTRVSIVDVNVSLKPVFTYVRYFGVCNVVNMERSVTTIHGESHSEEYREVATVFMDFDALDALNRLKAQSPYALFFTVIDIYEFPFDGDKTHELYIVMDDMKEVILENKALLEDYFRPTGVNPHKVEKEYTPESIIFDVLYEHISQVVFKFTNMGFDAQEAYAEKITYKISRDIIDRLLETIMSGSNLCSDPIRATKSLTKISSAIAMRARTLISEKLGEVLVQNAPSHGFYDFDSCICDLNAHIMGTVLEYAHILHGFNYTKRGLESAIKDFLSNKVQKTPVALKLINYASKYLPPFLLSNIDTEIKRQTVSPPVSYYNLALLALDELKQDLFEAYETALKDEESVGKEIFNHFNIIDEKVEGVVNDVVNNYISDFYAFAESPLNAKCIQMIKDDLDEKLLPIIGAGILNKGDYKVHLYINDDMHCNEYCNSYGFIDFKQDVTPFQIGVTKKLLEEMTWDIEYSKFLPIEIRINKIKK